VGGGAHAAPPLLYLHSLPSPARPPPDNCQRRGPAPLRHQAEPIRDRVLSRAHARFGDATRVEFRPSGLPLVRWCARPLRQDQRAGRGVPPLAAVSPLLAKGSRRCSRATAPAPALPVGDAQASGSLGPPP
jgi:hypothetical protein